MTQIFISYRRSDSAGHARALHRDLVKRLGADRIFFDRQSIESGDDFPEELEQGVVDARVLLALIAPGWLNATDDRGLRRLDDPKDYVRREIAMALELNKRVMPILFDDTPVPGAQHLPECLTGLASKDALTLRGKNYEYDVQLAELFRLLAISGITSDRQKAVTARRMDGPPKDPPPENLKLVFNRSLQDQMLSSKLRQNLNAGQKVLACLLPGPTDESHSDFIARYQAFTLRDVCQLLRIRYSVSEQPLRWPEARWADKDRLPFLRNELGRLLGIADVTGLSDSELRLAVSRWVAQEQKHVVAVFHLNPYCSSDEALIESWLRFWEGLDLQNTSYSLTVFLCVYCERAKWRGFFRGPRVCLKRLKQKFGSVSEVVSLDELESPRGSDVTVWVNTDCPRAWQLAGHGDEKLPLHLDELRMRTLESFEGRKSRPFEQLKGKLGDAIKQAYERYHREGSGR